MHTSCIAIKSCNCSGSFTFCIIYLKKIKGIQLDEIQGLRKKTETELKFTATSLNLTSRNINTSWNKDVNI